MSPVRHHKRRHVKDDMKGELRKIKPPTFEGNNNKGEYFEAWLIKMRKYL